MLENKLLTFTPDRCSSLGSLPLFSCVPDDLDTQGYEKTSVFSVLLFLEDVRNHAVVDLFFSLRSRSDLMYTVTVYDVELAGFAMAWFVAIPLVHYLLQNHRPLLWLVQCEGITSSRMKGLRYMPNL